MKKYVDYKIEKDTLSSIDKSIKQARKLELGKYPYAIVLNPNNASEVNLDNLTCLPAEGLKTIPIVKHPNIEKDKIVLTYDENTLISILQKPL